MSIIQDLNIKESNYYFLDENQKELNDLSRVNILIGENNSGKSRFLRSIFYKNDSKLEFIPNDEKFKNYAYQRNQLNIDLEKRKEDIKIPPKRKLIYDKISQYLPSADYLTESEYPFEKINELYMNKNDNQRDERIVIFNKYFKDIDFLDKTLFRYDFYKIYIPSLRGLLPLIPDKTISTNYVQQKHINEFISEDVFGQRTKNDYFGENSNILLDITDSLIETITESNNSIITGHYFYKYVQEFLLGNLDQREIIKDYQEYLSENFFENKDVALIPKLEDEVLTVKIGDEEEQKIYNLGEGIQSIILITLPLFLYLNKSKEENTNILVFIEEPEVGLHPALQRKLLEILLDERFENYQFFFTTHSNHFIDQKFSKYDISIYLFDKQIFKENNITKFNIKKVDFNHFPTLKKLGALPSSVMASNCTILVEGSHDIVHYSHYLDLYQKKLKEETPDLEMFEEKIHYSFLRGGGKETKNTIKKFNPIEKERIFTILDFDNESESEKNKKDFEDIGYENYAILDVKEVENLISKKVLIEILKDVREIRKLGINEDFDEQDYQKSKFHKFIEDEIITGEKPSNFFKKDGMKKKLSQKEAKFAKSYDDLSDAGKEITEKIYEFIKNKNNMI